MTPAPAKLNNSSNNQTKQMKTKEKKTPNQAEQCVSFFCVPMYLFKFHTCIHCILITSTLQLPSQNISFPNPVFSFLFYNALSPASATFMHGDVRPQWVTS